MLSSNGKITFENIKEAFDSAPTIVQLNFKNPF